MQPLWKIIATFQQHRFCKNSGGLAIFAAIRRASSDRRLGQGQVVLELLQVRGGEWAVDRVLLLDAHEG
jgi:hypothetical protein